MNKIKKCLCNNKYAVVSLIFGFLVSIFALVLWQSGYYFSVFKGVDIHTQHSFYMEYFRQNLYYSGDMLPDLGMNFGMMQNFATLYYYGFFNIFVRGLAFFPMLNAYQYQFIVNILVYILVFYFMTKLLRYLDFKFNLVIFGSTLVALAPALTWFHSRHAVYGYPYMFFILALLGLAKLVKEDKIFLFTISNVLIIVTNLFQLQTTGLYALVFYVFYVLYLGVDKKIIKKSLIKVFLSYALAAGICALVILPQFYLFKSGSRYELNEISLPNVVNFNSISKFITVYFKFGFGFLSSMLITSMFFTKKKYITIPTLMILLIIFNLDIPYIFNLFSLEDKVYFYVAPVAVILILFALKDSKEYFLRKRVIFTAISLILYIILFIMNNYGKNFYHPISYYLIIKDFLDYPGYSDIVLYIVVVSPILMYMLYMFEFKKTINKIMLPTLLVVYIFSALSYNTVVSSFEYISHYRNSYSFDSTSDEFSMYRNNDPSIEEVGFTASKNVVYNYASFVNPYYHNYFNEYIDLPAAHQGIAINTFRTSGIINRVLSIESEETTKPIIYGSYNVIDYDEWMNIERPLRITASLQGPAVNYKSDANYIPIDIFDEVNLIEELYDHEFKYRESEIFENANETSGEYIVIMDVGHSGRVTMYVNGKRNEKSHFESRYYNYNDVFTFYVPADETGLKATQWSYVIEYDRVRVYHISEDAINSYENDYIHPDNFETDYNNGFNFDITMQQDGVLATTIPFDEGYKILVDGKEVNVELIDGSFIGAELSEGTHQVEIIYTTPGKNLGIIISIGSILVFIYLLKKRGF